MKTGIGVIRKIGGSPSSGVIAVERGPGSVAGFMVEPDVVQALVERFGVPEGDRINMQAAVGRRVEYEESDFGFITRLVVLDQDP